MPCYAGFTTKLSSAGLVYKHYGREIISIIMGKPQGDPAVEAVFLRVRPGTPRWPPCASSRPGRDTRLPWQVYKVFMEAIDGIDNGAPGHCAAGVHSRCC